MQLNLLRPCSGVLGLLCLLFPHLVHARFTNGPIQQSTNPTIHPSNPASTNAPLPKPADAIPWSQLGARAGANYKGDGLAISRTETGARLRCSFQQLEGHATTEGLWLVSTVTNSAPDRFRLIAMEVARGAQSKSLSSTGTVAIADNLVRFIRPQLIEEYTVSMDGVRQDFLVLEKPALPLNSHPSTLNLRVDLSVTGAAVEPTADGAQLVLEKSGRKIAYSRLKATDANGKELPARLQVQDPSAFSLQPSAFHHLSVLIDDSNAAYPIRIDPTFSDANWISMGGFAGTDGPVYAFAVAGSDLYAGGSFAVAGGNPANNIAKWNGTRWSPLGSGVNGPVRALAVSGNDLYVGGEFTIADGNTAHNIAKWNGTNWSPLGSGVSDQVNALAVSGNDLYAGGWFTEADGNPAAQIAKWNGTNWSALGSGMNGLVWALAVSGQELYAGGWFTTAGGVTVNYIARWNGSIWSALGSGMNAGVNALAVSGTNLYAGGDFSRAGGVSALRVARWNGSSWSTTGSLDGTVRALAVLGSDLYAGGDFTTVGGVTASRIAKWNGSSWSALGSGIDGVIHALVGSGTNLYAGGASVAKHIAKWNGSSWSGLGPGIDGPYGPSVSVYALAVSGSNLYVGGEFLIGGEVKANRIAKWNGSSWSALGSGVEGTQYPRVDALAVSGSDLYAGGYFTTAGGTSANYIAKWNGNSWSALGSGVNGYVSALAVSGSDLYAAGDFTTAGGNPANHIAKWNGSSWSPLGSGLSGLNGNYVSALAVSGGDLYAGGTFTTAGGTPATAIAKWNGSTWSALGSGLWAGNYSGYVYVLAVFANELYAGGYFTTAGGVPATNIAKWDGSSWSPLGAGMRGGPTTRVVSGLVVSGSDLYAGGGFTNAGGISANYIAKWNGSTWSPLGSGLSGPLFSSVRALAVLGSNLYAGGSFTNAGGKLSPYITRAVLGDAPGYNQLTGKRLSDDAMRFSYIGYPATNYALDRAFNLAPPINWVGQKTNTMTISGVLTFTNTPAPGTNNFWRVRSVP